jgi:hypothetical protein
MKNVEEDNDLYIIILFYFGGSFLVKFAASIGGIGEG